MTEKEREGEREGTECTDNRAIVRGKEKGKPDIWRSARSKEGPILHPAVAPVIIALLLPSCSYCH